jgi:hypothetical protein
MKLSDLVSELRENILHDRSDRVAGADDYLWSEATLIRYINEAQRRFARRSLCIRDGRTQTIKLRTGVTQYDLDPAVIAVISAKLSTESADLTRAGHAALDAYRLPTTTFLDTSLVSTLPPGKPIAYSTDEDLAEDETGSVSAISVRVYPEPTATYNNAVINLRVLRLPLRDLSADHMSETPEVPEDHHLEMLDWAAYLALRMADLDAELPARAEMFRKSFEQHCREARSASLRKLFAPTTWGFGRGGFAWEK